MACRLGRRGARITRTALAFRVVHAAISVLFLAAIGYVWWCVITGMRGRLLRIAVGSLVVEGVVVAVNRGDCPLGGLQEQVGDPVPLFELVLPPRLAKLAVPVLGLIAGGGIALLSVGPFAGRPAGGSRRS